MLLLESIAYGLLFDGWSVLASYFFDLKCSLLLP